MPLHLKKTEVKRLRNLRKLFGARHTTSALFSLQQTFTIVLSETQDAGIHKKMLSMQYMSIAAVTSSLSEKPFVPLANDIVNIIINYHKGGLTQCYHSKIRIYTI